MSKRTLAVMGLALVGSQAGHMLAYQLRYGAAALQVQSTGAHAYFPILAKTGLGALAAILIGALFVIGLSKVLAGRALARAHTRPSYLGLAASLFTIQLACFVGQEMIEAAVAGAPVGSVEQLLLWGILGQLPVAAVGALALVWLATRFEAAVDEIRAVLAVGPPWFAPALAAIAIAGPSERALLMSRVGGASLGKRGPPCSS
jgi:hypothetical protein